MHEDRERKQHQQNERGFLGGGGGMTFEDEFCRRRDEAEPLRSTVGLEDEETASWEGTEVAPLPNENPDSAMDKSELRPSPESTPPRRLEHMQKKNTMSE